jgi:bifunctional DNA-binding transcriptional regulator/antitoxin component of YhaV-PrlF toxin-antitoxin module
VSKNGQVVLSASARRTVGIEPGDLVVVLPLAPGTLVVERVQAAEPLGLRRQFERGDNPLRGVWGADPDYWLEELRGRWKGPEGAS